MITISVCVGSACHLKGSYDVIETFQNLIEKHNVKEYVELKGAFCLGHCTGGVSVMINEEDKIYSLSKECTEEFFCQHILGRIS